MPFVLLKDPYRWGKIGYRLRERFRRIFRHTIFTAIESGTDEEALRLSSQRVLVRARDEWGGSPLVAAINKRRPMLVREFIRRGGMRPGDGSLAHASMAGDLAVVRMLLAANKDPNEPLPPADTHDNRYTPLTWAANRRFVPIVQALLEAGADVNGVGADGTTAIMCTFKAEPADLEVLDVLCRYKADVIVTDWRGRNIIHEARDRARCSGKLEMRKILENYYPDINFD
ncbi:ankyrin repeat protein [Massilia sp. MP_M2]|uniref:ankyrin repeat domain-containing protein n=1 Tax=Massilia sp. MP_M2 TaxID=3071713 RepID=UPI00319E9B1B